MTAEELNRQFPAQGTFRDRTVFRLGVRNYYYPKVFIDPASIVMRSLRWPQVVQSGSCVLRPSPLPRQGSQ